MSKAISLASLLTLAAVSPSFAQVERIGPPSSLILQAAVVPAGTDIMYVSGIVPPPLNPQPAGAPPVAPVFGDTKTQTINVLTRIGEILKLKGLSHADVFMMRVVLVGDPAKGGAMDFAGMMEGYRMFYGTPEQPNKTARITTQISALVQPGMLVEIEVQAAFPKKAS
jgi:enamine deaminase RidA (YjgF/YER057c/UK114 family)